MNYLLPLRYVETHTILIFNLGIYASASC